MRKEFPAGSGFQKFRTGVPETVDQEFAAKGGGQIEISAEKVGGERVQKRPAVEPYTVVVRQTETGRSGFLDGRRRELVESGQVERPGVVTGSRRHRQSDRTESAGKRSGRGAKETDGGARDGGP